MQNFVCNVDAEIWVLCSGSHDMSAHVPGDADAVPAKPIEQPGVNAPLSIPPSISADDISVVLTSSST